MVRKGPEARAGVKGRRRRPRSGLALTPSTALAPPQSEWSSHVCSYPDTAVAAALPSARHAAENVLQGIGGPGGVDEVVVADVAGVDEGDDARPQRGGQSVHRRHAVLVEARLQVEV